MAFEKGCYIDDYKVSFLLKTADGVATYRVRNPDGKLCVLKFGVSEREREFAKKTDLYLSSGDRYVVYRHISGETLDFRLRRLVRLDEDEALEITKGILEKLALIHENNMIHANLTADNIVVDLGWERPVPFIVGYGHLEPASLSGVTRDLYSVGRLINWMLTGENTERLKVRSGKMSLLEIVMLKALVSEFSSAREMLSVLDGSSPVSYVPKPTGPGFSAVAGMDSLKEQLRTEVLEILSDKEGAERYGIDIPNGMLLYGPPGCGKTFLAERFAEEAGYNYKYVKSSDLASTYVHGSQEKIAALFDEARKNAPTILCFDEFDALVPSRDDTHLASHSGEVNEFLTQLNNCGKDGVFVIATSNRPDRIDSAILRTGRIDYVVYVPVPDKESRRKIFELAVKDRPHEENIDCRVLAGKTEGFLASDITAAVQQAARMAFKSKSLLSTDLLLSVVRQRQPSLSRSELARYVRLRETFEKQRNVGGQNKIGFIP
ncbi:MAG: AAA family ATPase [Clostridium sp.]|nr:AAA family ATPase [Clostridium sp.]